VYEGEGITNKIHVVLLIRKQPTPGLGEKEENKITKGEGNLTYGAVQSLLFRGGPTLEGTKGQSDCLGLFFPTMTNNTGISHKKKKRGRLGGGRGHPLWVRGSPGGEGKLKHAIIKNSGQGRGETQD